MDQLLSSEDLLVYYKRRINDFDDERQDIIERLSYCSVDQTEVHKLEWENKKRTEEIWSLQKALSETHKLLFDERERLLKMQSEMDILKIKEIEDERKIQQLMRMCHPGEQEIAYTKDSKPDVITNVSRQNNLDNTKEFVSIGNKGERVMRTVYLPTANADVLLLKVEALQSQIYEQQQYYNERIAALLEDRKIRERDIGLHHENYQKQIESYSKKINSLEEMLRNTTKDYILIKKEKQLIEEQVNVNDHQKKNKIEVLEKELSETKETLSEKIKKLKENNDETIDDYIEQFRQQVRERDEKISELEELNNIENNLNKNKIKELELKLKMANDKRLYIEQRRAMDHEGYGNELSLLKNQMIVIDKRLQQLNLLFNYEDDDRLDSMIQRLENKIPKQKNNLKWNSMSEFLNDIELLKKYVCNIDIIKTN